MCLAIWAQYSSLLVQDSKKANPSVLTATKQEEKSDKSTEQSFGDNLVVNMSPRECLG